MACFLFEVLCSLKLREQFNAFAHVLGQTYEQVQRYHDLQFNISSNVLEYIKNYCSSATICTNYNNTNETVALTEIRFLITPLSSA